MYNFGGGGVCEKSCFSLDFLFPPDWNADVMAGTAVIKLEPSVEITFKEDKTINKVFFLAKRCLEKNTWGN